MQNGWIKTAVSTAGVSNRVYKTPRLGENFTSSSLKPASSHV